MLEGPLPTRSKVRRCCYKIRHEMIVSQLQNFIWCTIVGFLFNSPIMGSIIIVYEKVIVSFNVVYAISNHSHFFSTLWIKVNTAEACYPSSSSSVFYS